MPTQAARSGSDSPLPDWLSQHASPAKAVEMLSDSDDAVEMDAEEGEPTKGSKRDAIDEEHAGHCAGQAGEQHAAEGLGSGVKGKRKATTTVLLSSDDDKSPLPKAPSRQGAVRKKQKLGAGKAAPLEAGPGPAAGRSIGLTGRGGPDLQQASA